MYHALPHIYRRNTKRGFTLIEILIVIAIIAILATIILVSLNSAKLKARNAVRLSDLHEISNAAELYNVSIGHYPISLATTTECTTGGTNWIPDGSNYSWNQPYGLIPRDPSSPCASDPSKGFSYWSDGMRYVIGATLEDPTNPNGQAIAYDGTSYTAVVGSTSAAGQLILTLSTTASDPTNNNPIQITATFSEAVVDFDQSVISLINAILTDFTGGVSSIFTFFVTPQSNGDVTVTVPGDVVHDQNGVGNSASQITITYDSQKPHPALSPDPLPLAVNGVFTVTVNFNLPVVDMALSDVTVQNGTASNLQEIAPLNGQNYSFDITPTVPGTVTLWMPAGGVHTDAGNPNVDSNTISTTYAP